ncbi:DUF6443 domain-containing protein, partial [Terrimonas sp. NA20]
MNSRSVCFKLGIAWLSVCLAGNDVSAQTPYLPAAYNSGIPVSYVRTWDAMKPDTNAAAITTAMAARDFRMTTQYVDGLGRPIQNVVKHGSMHTGYPMTDMVEGFTYDEFGREKFRFLPFQSSGGNPGQSDGLFKTNPWQQQVYSLGNIYVLSPLKGQDETFLYSQTNFEPSPLNRVTETFSPGSSWAGTASQATEAARRSVKIRYLTNTAFDSVRIWNVTNGGSVGAWGTYSTTAMYPAGQLTKIITIDEHGKQLIEFTDKQGKVILKKVQLTASADDGNGKGHSGWICTYYLYDDLGNLRCVIQPKGVAVIASNWLLTSTEILAEQCFRYEYDERNRMIVKKVPGAGETYMVYDFRDRLIMTQDAVMRATTPARWNVTKYDDLNRVIETGLLSSAGSFSSFRDSAATSLAIPNTSSNYFDLTTSHYDDYAGLPAGLNGNFIDTLSSQFHASSASPLYAQPLVASAQVRGLPTWTSVKVINSLVILYSINIYDEKGRVIQVKSRNRTGGNDFITTQYNWSGQPLITLQRIQKAGNKAVTVVIMTKYVYDDLARLVRLEKRIGHSQINSGALQSSYTHVLTQNYDAMGQLKTKKLAPAFNGNQGLETLNYDYNVRGWMLGVNRAYVKDSTSVANHFGFDLGYDKTALSINGVNTSYASGLFNGNIGGMLWKSTGDDQLRKYDFGYDAANRLTGADFNEFRQQQFGKSGGIDFSVSGLSYDVNGNILSMNQKGLKGSSSFTIDSLLYTYIGQSNKLRSVIDRVNDTATKLGDFRSDKLYMDQLGSNKTTGATDYTYNVNGSLTRDLNKSINQTSGGDGIQYNAINMVSRVHSKKDNSTSRGYIDYEYAADGTKLQKIVTEFGVDTVSTLYLGNAVFTDDSLSFIGMEEGRIRRVGSTFVYDYFIKDHLGNVRMILTD